MAVLVFTNQRLKPVHRPENAWFSARSDSAHKEDASIPDSRLPGSFLLGSDDCACVQGAERSPGECTGNFFKVLWPNSSLVPTQSYASTALGQQIHGLMSCPLVPAAIPEEHKASRHH